MINDIIYSDNLIVIGQEFIRIKSATYVTSGITSIDVRTNRNKYYLWFAVLCVAYFASTSSSQNGGIALIFGFFAMLSYLLTPKSIILGLGGVEKEIMRASQAANIALIKGAIEQAIAGTQRTQIR